MLRLFAIAIVLNGALLALEIPRHAGFGPNWFAFEAFLVTGAFALLPERRWTRWLATTLGVLAALLTLLTLADALARFSVNRPLNLYLDLPMALSVYELVRDNGSVLLALGAIAALLLGLAAIALGTSWLLRRLAALDGRAARIAAGVLLASGLLGVFNGPSMLQPPRAITPALTLLSDQARWIARTHQEKRDFERLLAEADDRRGPLSDLAGVDVIVGLIESYGVSAVFDERYAGTVKPKLADLEAAVAERGLHMVTGTLDAPIFGGQSWLSHASLLTGLWIDSHLRYQLLLDSDWSSLIAQFNRTGHETVTLMPANTRAWPAGEWYGYDQALGAADLDYAGPEFNWVTMPDQYVWSFFENEIRTPSERPVFAKLALISSHAPWVPVLPVIEDWERIGDGSIFEQWAGTGTAPEALWREPARVREQYARAVAYSLATATGYTKRYVDDKTLLILMGDHQSAPIITGPDASPAVPVHVISGDPSLLAAFRDRGFRPGAIPTAATGEHALDDLRGWLQTAFGSDGQ